MRNHQLPGRSVVMSADAMAATSQPLATEVALQTMRDGGNALDAAIAASATLSVVETYSSGIGGDCFILYHEAKTGKLHAINGSGAAPAAATLEALNARGHTEVMPEYGILPVTVPGAIDAWHSANQSLGNLPFGDLFKSAIKYARDGYAVSPIIASNWKNCESLLLETEAATNACLVNGKAPEAGSIHRQPDLANSLELIAKEGPDAFYRGALTEEIVRYSNSQNGLLSLYDFDRHRTDWVDPISSDYRGYKVCQIPPNGQGITTLMTLNALAKTDVSKHPHLSSDHIHLLSEAFTQAMAERDQFISDPKFSDLPIDQMLGDDLASSMFNQIDMANAMSQPVQSALPNHKDTVYITVVDKDRNACSFINSVFHSWGSGLIAGSTGINLQNRGAGFSLELGHFNQLEPFKRPMHTIIPSMVYKDDKPVLCFGVMGGQYQAMGQAYVLSNWIDYGMDIQESLDAARFFLYDGELAVEPPISNDVRDNLKSRGHNVIDSDGPHGGGQAIVIDWEKGTLQGGSDPRKDGMAAGF
jgi:gamma-glutamyltranspeptidase / glutathione hydrolase